MVSYRTSVVGIDVVTQMSVSWLFEDQLAFLYRCLQLFSDVNVSIELDFLWSKSERPILV